MNQFDKIAFNWDENPKRVMMMTKIMEAYAQFQQFDKLGHLLDYGSGTGLLGLQLSQFADKITFCDSSINMLEQLKQKLEKNSIKNVQTLFSDFSTDDVVENEYDTIATSLALHHVYDMPQLVTNFEKALKPNGQLIVIDLITEDGTFHSDDIAIAHKGFSQEEMKNYFNNFDIKSFNIAYTLKKPANNGPEKSFPIFLMQARIK